MESLTQEEEKKIEKENNRKYGRTDVDWESGKLIEAPHGNREIYTRGAGGCNVVAIEGCFAENKVRFAAITHFAPDSIQANIDKIHQLGKQIKNRKIVETNATIFVLGERVVIDGKQQVVAVNEEQTDDLIRAVKKTFGEEVKTTITPYNSFDDEGKVVVTGEIWIDLSDPPSRDKRINHGIH